MEPIKVSPPRQSRMKRVENRSAEANKEYPWRVLVNKTFDW